MSEAQAWLLIAVACTLGLGTGRDTFVQLTLAAQALIAYVLAILAA